MTPDLPDDLIDRFRSGTKRIERFEHEGRVIWVKRVERLSGRKRFQKGDPVRAFEAERAAYHALRRADAPVAELAAEGDAFLATFDAGPTLRALARGGASEADLTRALSGAATALAGLHARGLVHGRPAIKDICWQDGRITFLDFERTARVRKTPAKMADDVILFIFSAIVEPGFKDQMLASARSAYRAEDRSDIWAIATRKLRRMAWAPRLSAPLISLLRNKPEFRAIPKIFAFFAA